MVLLEIRGGVTIETIGKGCGSFADRREGGELMQIREERGVVREERGGVITEIVRGRVTREVAG